MDLKIKCKPLVIIQCYEEREINRQYAANERRSPETLQNKTTKLGTLSDTSATLTPPPPPPPPGATNSSNKLNGLKPKTKIAPPVPVKYSTLSYKQESRPPPCPTPDYDNISINSNSTLAKAYTNRYAQKQTKTSQKNDVVEMESLESFKLNNPSKYPPPKPPNTYFNKIQTNGEKKQRPVSVTIGQYPSGSLRKQPGKLDFLQNGYDEHGTNGDDSINTKLASELAYALNRSNLKRRTESMENLLNGPHIKPQSNGSVTISLNNGLGHEDLNEKKSNRVTINITSAGDKKSGILKNGNGQLL